MARLGERIAEFRKAADLTQAEASAKIGVHPVTLARWETDRQPPTLDNLRAIARALNTDVLSLLGEEITAEQLARRIGQLDFWKLSKEYSGDRQRLIQFGRLFRDAAARAEEAARQALPGLQPTPGKRSAPTKPALSTHFGSPAALSAPGGRPRPRKSGHK